ncbi:SWIM zinc finger family protein [Brachybacterium muris]|uniref:SWIM zinc finger family protein n=1 Tax=Brachybacterium muris TaxID=219301 RepID=UPI0021A5D462|nr:SWIM zinc finger family protein [Brachybacterium muris]MCT1997954.1 SWIM zinc finger family protein [Brachybacterium muris]
MSIQLRSRRGPIGVGWHAVALRRAIESLLGGSRASGGRADARAGRVAWIDVTRGAARGAVQDSDGELYRPQLDLTPYSAPDREAFLAVARAHPELPARMAAGEYPQLVEKELSAHEVSLLPRGPSELSHDCSCLDWPGPCRHVAALAYVLVEAVDEKPLTLLTLRGLRIEDLVAPAAGTSARSAPAAPQAATPTAPPPGAGDNTPSPDDATGKSTAAGDSTATGRNAGIDGRNSGITGGTVGNQGEDSGSVDGSAHPSPGFDPSRADPSLLAAVLGEHAAALIAAFYQQGSQDDEPPHPLR